MTNYLKELRSDMPESFPAWLIAVTQDLDMGTDDLWFGVRREFGVPHEEIHVSINCNDFFAWATSDAESIEPGDRELLMECLKDLGEAEAAELDRKKEAGEEVKYGLYYDLHLFNLFACRKRGQRPQGAWLYGYKDRQYCPKPLVPLFEAAGDARGGGIWNPIKSPDATEDSPQE